jgi:hypothetical protein
VFDRVRELNRSRGQKEQKVLENSIAKYDKVTAKAEAKNRVLPMISHNGPLIQMF